MDACGIGFAILSLNAPAIQGIPDSAKAIDVARRANDILAEQVAAPSGNFRTIAMRNAMEEIGTEPVLFSVDYPFESMQEGATWFDAAEIGENDRDNIGRRNAARLFNLPNNL
jgi:predicted TIM-barrel fold metal-dependent hydrolase